MRLPSNELSIVNNDELRTLKDTLEKYKSALGVCLKAAEDMQDIMYLEEEDAKQSAKHLRTIVETVYRTFYIPVISVTGKAVKGDTFYKAKVDIKLDTSG